MKLKTLVNILKGGNVALGQKLSNLLTEDCVILEYTDDAVLFSKDNRLVLAKFKHNLSESKMTSDNIVDNELLYISGEETATGLRDSVKDIIDDLVEGNIVDAEDRLKLFCETYFQYHILRSNYPQVFTENLSRQSKGYKLRKKGFSMIPKFKAEVFSSVMMNEDTTLDITDSTTLIESFGPVLFLGKTVVTDLVKDALLQNESLTESVITALYETATSLPDLNEDLEKELKNGYDLTTGRFLNEQMEDVSEEDYTKEDHEIDHEFPMEDHPEPEEFSEFDPSKLSEDEVKELHIETLKAILTSMQEFVIKKANEAEETSIPPDMDVKLKEDLETLQNPEASSEELSQIEARWSPVISYFLDSDLYTPETDEVPEEVKLDDTLSPEEEEPEEAAAKAPAEEVPPTETPAPGTEEEEQKKV